jgi:hypothetical protein
MGGGASQFSIEGGKALAAVAQTDLAVYSQDDWRWKPNVTLSYGLRYETQTNIGDRHDFAPRIGFAWAPHAQQGKPQKTVIRVGAGVYYDRVAQNLTMQQLRYNGVNQQQYLILDPDFFPNVPAVSSLLSAARPVNTYKMDAHLRAPRMAQGAISIDHQLPGKTTASVTYMGMHTSHTLRYARSTSTRRCRG